MCIVMARECVDEPAAFWQFPPLQSMRLIRWLPKTAEPHLLSAPISDAGVLRQMYTFLHFCWRRCCVLVVKAHPANFFNCNLKTTLLWFSQMWHVASSLLHTIHWPSHRCHTGRMAVLLNILKMFEFNRGGSRCMAWHVDLTQLLSWTTRWAELHGAVCLHLLQQQGLLWGSHGALIVSSQAMSLSSTFLSQAVSHVVIWFLDEGDDEAVEMHLQFLSTKPMPILCCCRFFTDPACLSMGHGTTFVVVFNLKKQQQRQHTSLHVALRYKT